MAREHDQLSGRRSGDVDMTSMVDVTFLLLIFFMVTAAFQLQKSIEVPRERSDTRSSFDDFETPQIHVQVDQFGSFLVMTPDWELETPGKQKLIVALKQAASESSLSPRLAIKVHQSAKLRSLVDVLDAGSSAGMAGIEVEQLEQM